MLNSCLAGKKILLGVTGGIAAYKTPELVRLLVKAGADVRVILSQGAQDFVTPLTLETVSGNPVSTSCFEAGEPMRHIELAKWADIFLIAPLSANRLAALAHGFADDLLTTTYLATSAQVMVAPAMNKQMWEHPAVVENMRIIQLKATVIGPETGEQACQDVGFGRMTEPTDIIHAMTSSQAPGLFEGVTILLTAGPTREAIDPVRFISNKSSGKMGYQLAQQARYLGAKVILISGPVHQPLPSGVEVINVETAQQMYAEVTERLGEADIFIGCAAVADYRVQDPKAIKHKKQDREPWRLVLEQTPDILSTVAAQPNRPFCVGFAAETHQGEYYAQQKLQQKNIDMIALNAVDKPDQGFETDSNALTVYWQDQQRQIPLNHKSIIAKEFLQLISEIYHEKKDRA